MENKKPIEFKIDPIEFSLKADGQPFLQLYAPKGDQTISGTCASLKEKIFKFEKVSFEPGDVFIDFGV